MTCPACAGALRVVVLTNGRLTHVCDTCERRARLSASERAVVECAHWKARAKDDRRLRNFALAENRRLIKALKRMGAVALTYRRARDQLQQFTNRRLKRVA